MKRLLLLSLFFFSLSCAHRSHVGIDQRFQKDLDDKPIAMPESNDPSERWDQFYNHFLRQFYRALYLPNLFGQVEADNVNDWDEVPDSSWFTNRIGKNPEAWDEKKARQGARVQGPDLSNPWHITRGKTDGVTPGFTIKDSRGDTYFIKFDPPGFQELGTSAEIISSLILHAAGYNVPAYFVEEIPVAQFVVDPKAKTYGKYGKKRPMTDKDFFNILTAANIDKNGSTRVVASLAISGKPIGPFMYEGTRSDDPNDDIPHENRRELRGFHIFSAWLNNTDVRFQNTLDVYIGEKDKGHIKHYLLDFGTSLGSGGNREKNIKVGYEYAVDFSTMGRNFVTLGVEKPYWKDVRPTIFPSIGTFESKIFDPPKWRSQYANRAFELITPRDGFWAAKLIMKFTDQHIRAIVDEARYSNPEAKEYMIKTLIERRNKIGNYWFNQVTPIDDFSIENRRLIFTDLEIASGLSSKTKEYTLTDDLGNKQKASTNSQGQVSFQLIKGSDSLQIRGNGPGVDLSLHCSAECLISKVERLD